MRAAASRPAATVRSLLATHGRAARATGSRGFGPLLARSLLLIAVAGCGTQDAIRPASIDLLFVVQTVGIDLDTDGYTLSLDGGTPIPLPLNGEVDIPNVPVMDHDYEIRGIAGNCRIVHEAASGTLRVRSGNTTYEITVLCLQTNPGRLLYTVSGGGRGGLRSRDAHGHDYRRLFDDVNSVAATQDGTQLAFAVDGDIWTASVDGLEAVNVTNTVGRLEERPDWSPDGSRIVFEASESGGIEWDIYLMSADGSGTVNLTPNTDEWSHAEPAWSPHGDRIVFRSDRTDARGLYTITPSGGNLTRLTNGTDVNPRWSPRGERIVFGRFLDPATGGTNYELFTIEADGTGLTQLTANEGFNTTDADWSPDGRWMVIASRPLTGTALYDLYSMSPDGRHILQLTFFENAQLPRWIP